MSPLQFEKTGVFEVVPSGQFPSNVRVILAGHVGSVNEKEPVSEDFPKMPVGRQEARRSDRISRVGFRRGPIGRPDTIVAVLGGKGEKTRRGPLLLPASRRVM